MDDPAEALAVGAPAQVGAGIHGACRGVVKVLAGNGGERHVIDGQRRLAGSSPHRLVRVRGERVDDIAKTRSLVRGVFIGELGYAEVESRHVTSSPSDGVLMGRRLRTSVMLTPKATLMASST